MSKKQKLYDLRLNVSTKAQEIEILMEHIIIKAEGERDADVMANIVLEKARRISRMSSRIGRILRH